MSLSSKKDRAIQKDLENQERKKKMSTVPPDNYGENYIDPMTQNLRTQGKGSKVRDISGWQSEAVSERLRKIYGKEEKIKEEETVTKDDA